MLEGSKTEQELVNAFVGESIARNKYTMYSKIAKKEGYEKIAEIFLDTAENEREHAKLFYNHIPQGDKEIQASYPFFIGSTEENLLAAYNGEKEEWDYKYKNSAEIAKSEGYKEIANLFTEIIEVEKRHSHRFAELNDLIKANKIFKRDTEMQWECRKCGHTQISKCAPKECPLCGHPQAYFEPFCDKY